MRRKKYYFVTQLSCDCSNERQNSYRVVKFKLWVLQTSVLELPSTAGHRRSADVEEGGNSWTVDKTFTLGMCSHFTPLPCSSHFITHWIPDHWWFWKESDPRPAWIERMVTVWAIPTDPMTLITVWAWTGCKLGCFVDSEGVRWRWELPSCPHLNFCGVAVDDWGWWVLTCAVRLCPEGGWGLPCVCTSRAIDFGLLFNDCGPGDLVCSVVAVYCGPQSHDSSSEWEDKGDRGFLAQG